MYYIATALVSVYNVKNDKFENGTTVESKIEQIIAHLEHIPSQIYHKITKLIIINPNKMTLKHSEIKDYLTSQAEKFNKLKISHLIDMYLRTHNLINSAIILNNDKLKFNISVNEDTGLEVIEGSFDISVIKNIVKSEPIIFYGPKVDKIIIDVLLNHNNLEGYRKTYFAKFSNIKDERLKSLSAVEDIKEYLEYLKYRITDSHEPYKAKNIAAIYNNRVTIFGRKDTLSGHIEDTFTKQPIKLIIENDDEFLTKCIAVEIQDKTGKLYEYDCCNNDYEIKDNQKGLVFYNIDILSPEKLYKLCLELNTNEYAMKSVFMFSNKKKIIIGNLGFEFFPLPSIKDSNYHKLRLILSLALADDKLATTIPYYPADYSILTSLKSGLDMENFVIENGINSQNVRDRDFWYDLKLKYHPYTIYYFEHIMEHEDHSWQITWEGIEEPIKIKYYPNVVMMHLSYLIKMSPQEIDVQDLRSISDKWRELYLMRVKKSSHKFRDNESNNSSSKKHKGKDSRMKTKQEVDSTSIDQAIRHFFNNKLPANSETEIFKSLFSRSNLFIGNKCLYIANENVKIEIIDNYLDELLSDHK